jgi:hypothetical protein
MVDLGYRDYCSPYRNLSRSYEIIMKVHCVTKHGVYYVLVIITSRIDLLYVPAHDARGSETMQVPDWPRKCDENPHFC